MSVSFSDSSSSPTQEESVPPSVPASGSPSRPSPVAEKRALPSSLRVILCILGVLLLLSAVQLWALVIALASIAALVGLVEIAVLVYERHWIARFWAWWDARRARS